MAEIRKDEFFAQGEACKTSGLATVTDCDHWLSGGTGQSAVCRTKTPGAILIRVRFTGAAKDFSPRVKL